MTEIPQPLRLEPVDLGRYHLYDGFEPADYSQLLKLPAGTGDFTLSFSALSASGFAKLESVLGAADFHEVVVQQGYKQPEGPFGGWCGEDGLSLYFYLRTDPSAAHTELYLFSFGEFQPARYKVYFEGHWRIHHPESKH